MSILEDNYSDSVENQFKLSNFLPEHCANDLDYWERRFRTVVTRACGYYRYPDLFENLRKQFVGPDFIQVMKNDSDLDQIVQSNACTQVLDAICNTMRIDRNQPMDPMGYNVYTKLYSVIGCDTYVRRTILLKDDPKHKIAMVVYAMILDTACPRLELKLYSYFAGEGRWISPVQTTIQLLHRK